jgi:hypothetical protein
MLPRKGNAYDGYREQYAPEDMIKGCPQPAEKQPDDIAYQCKAAHTGRVADHALTKRPDHQPGQFEALHTEGNTDHGNAQDKATKEVSQRTEQPAEEKPD